MVGIVIALPAMLPVPLKAMLAYAVPAMFPLFVKLPPIAHCVTSVKFQPRLLLLIVTLPRKLLRPSAPSRSISKPVRAVLLVTVKLNEEQSQVLFVPMIRLPLMVKSAPCCTLVLPITVISAAMVIAMAGICELTRSEERRVGK